MKKKNQKFICVKLPCKLCETMVAILGFQLKVAILFFEMIVDLLCFQVIVAIAGLQ